MVALKDVACILCHRQVHSFGMSVSLGDTLACFYDCNEYISDYICLRDTVLMIFIVKFPV